MKFTKILALVLALIMVVALAACTEPAPEADTTTPSAPETTTEAPAGDDETTTAPDGETTVTPDGETTVTPDGETTVTPDGETTEEPAPETTEEPAPETTEEPEGDADEAAVAALSGVFKDATFTTGAVADYWSQVNSGSMEIKDGKLVITGEGFAQDYNHWNGLKGTKFKLYIKGTSTCSYIMFKSPNDVSPKLEYQLGSLLNGTAQEVEITFGDGYANGGGLCLAFGAGTAEIEYMQLVKIA